MHTRRLVVSAAILTLLTACATEQTGGAGVEFYASQREHMPVDDVAQCPLPVQSWLDETDAGMLAIAER